MSQISKPFGTKVPINAFDVFEIRINSIFPQLSSQISFTCARSVAQQQDFDECASLRPRPPHQQLWTVTRGARS